MQMKVTLRIKIKTNASTDKANTVLQ